MTSDQLALLLDAPRPTFALPTTATDEVLELFGGAGGATTGLDILGMSVVAVDYDADACRTHRATGHATIRADLTRPVPLRTRGRFAGVWASPPCTAFSAAGKGQGRSMADRLIAAIEAEDWTPWDDVDPAVWLVLPTMAAILEADPRWVAMENVPATRPVMEACAKVLARRGWPSTMVAVLCAEEYGVPQTRKRCFLMASKTAMVPPTPTHAKYRHPRYKPLPVDPSVSPWVSMATALGWPLDYATGHATMRGTGMKDRHGDRPIRHAADPSEVISSKTRSWSVVMDRRTNSKDVDGARIPTTDVPSSSPAPTITGVGGQAVWKLHTNGMANDTVREQDQPAPTLVFGHNAAAWKWVSDHWQRPLHHLEAARLQGFPDDHPWTGTRTSIFRQVGNAVPPPLAAIVAGTAAGVDWRGPVTAYLHDLIHHHDTETHPCPDS